MRCCAKTAATLLRRLFLVLSCCCCLFAPAETAVPKDKQDNILIVGNSQTDRNAMASTLYRMMQEFSPPDRLIGGREHIRQMSQFTSYAAEATKVGGESPLRTYLASGIYPWKWVILQEQSQMAGLVEDEYMFGASLRAAETLNEVVEAIGAETIWLQTWARQWGDSQYQDQYPDSKAMTAKVDEGYRRYMSVTSREGRPTYVAPCGLAFQRMFKPVVDDLNTEGSDFWNLYEEDGSHPSPDGSYLCACVLFATLSGRDPRLSTIVPFGLLEPETRHKLQQAAYDTMVDYYDWYKPVTNATAIENARKTASEQPDEVTRVETNAFIAKEKKLAKEQREAAQAAQTEKREAAKKAMLEETKRLETERLEQEKMRAHEKEAEAKRNEAEQKEQLEEKQRLETERLEQEKTRDLEKEAEAKRNEAEQKEQLEEKQLLETERLEQEKTRDLEKEAEAKRKEGETETEKMEPVAQVDANPTVEATELAPQTTESATVSTEENMSPTKDAVVSEVETVAVENVIKETTENAQPEKDIETLEFATTDGAETSPAVDADQSSTGGGGAAVDEKVPAAENGEAPAIEPEKATETEPEGGAENQHQNEDAHVATKRRLKQLKSEAEGKKRFLRRHIP